MKARRVADLEIEGGRGEPAGSSSILESLRLHCSAGMVAQAGSAEQAMPKELTLDGEGRLAERERPGEVRSSMQNPGRSRRAALTLPRQGRHRPRFPAYCNDGLAMMPSLIHRSFFLKFHEYEPDGRVSTHPALRRADLGDRPSLVRHRALHAPPYGGVSPCIACVGWALLVSNQ